jgi:outer membrane protein assembly factor BamB
MNGTDIAKYIAEKVRAFLTGIFRLLKLRLMGAGAFRLKRGEMEKRGRGSSRAARFTIPRLALWAGVGVFVFAMALSCGDDGPTEPTGNDEGVVYSVQWREENTNLVLVKFDAANGARLATYPIKDYKRDDLRATAVNRRNGDVYLAFVRGFVRMGSEGQIYFDRDFFLHSIYGDNDVLVDAGAKRVWVYDDGEFNLHDAATGDLLKTIRPIGSGAVSEYDNTLVAAASPLGPTELVKLSKDGDELWRREFSTERRTCVCIAVDLADGAIYVVSDNGRKPIRNIYFQKLTHDGEVIFDKEITPEYPERAEVSVLDRTIWAAGWHAYHLNGEGRIMKELSDKHYYSLALSRVGNKVFFGAGDPKPILLAIDTETYRVIWNLRFETTAGFVGWANAR